MKKAMTYIAILVDCQHSTLYSVLVIRDGTCDYVVLISVLSE
jgi:hypothetical protein